MPKLLSILLSVTILFPCNLTAQHIEVPLDTSTVIIDGVLSFAEWQNALSVMIPVNTVDSVEVKLKHDNTAMYFAFCGKLESANALFPEVLTDAANIGGSSWVAGQWWLHVSATDCENDGGYGVYNNCIATQPGWEGVPNFNTGPPITDTVEMRIPFSKVGFNPSIMDTMGIVMMVTNTASIFKLYPTTADRNIPGTWAKATFSKYPVNVKNINKREIGIHPNPCDGRFYVNVPVSDSRFEVIVRDMLGRIVKCTYDMEYAKVAITLPDAEVGLYTVEVTANNDAYTGRVLIRK